MPLLSNRIYDGGDVDLKFEDMIGNFTQQNEHIEVVARNGVVYPSLRAMGVRGDPITFQTVGFVASFQDAKDAEANYMLMQQVNAFYIMQHSVVQGVFNILTVRQRQAQAVENVINSYIVNPKVRQVCEWTAIAGYIEEP